MAACLASRAAVYFSSLASTSMVIALFMVCLLSSAKASQLEEKQALLQFRDGCERKDWHYFGNWSSNNHCDWDGVHCSSDGYVQSLVLVVLNSSTNITYRGSEIPWGGYLATLQKLEELSISGLLFGSALPPELGSLSRLKTLSLSGCGLLGPIPPQLGNLSRLQELDLSQQAGKSLYVLQGGAVVTVRVGNIKVGLTIGRRKLLGLSAPQITTGSYTQVGSPNGLPGFNGTAIPPQLCNLTRLVSLHLEWNLLNGIIPPCLFGLPSLATLDLSSNSLTGTLNDAFCVSAGGHSLITLSISHNALSGHLPDCLSTNFTSLQGLDLGSNNISGNLPLSLSNLSMMSSLNLSYNQLTGAFPSSTFFGMAEVDVSNNNLTSMEEPSSLAPASFAAVTTTSLWLGNNQISGPFPSWIWCVGSLKSLNLSMNRLSGQIVRTASDCVENQLDKVDLHGNNLSGEIQWEILQNCSLISMSGNHFSGEGLNLSNLMYLRSLDLSNNNLSGVVEVADGGPVISMSFLGLSNNRFSGKLPAVCSNRVKLDNNFFNGSIPSELLICCQAVILHNNRLTGPIPDAVKNASKASKLVLLDAAHNMLSGSLHSSWLLGLEYLRVLILGSNNFHGPLSSWNSRQLQVIDLSNNRLTGNIPAQSLPNLKAFCGSPGNDISAAQHGIDGTLANGSPGPLYDEQVVIQAKGQNLEFAYLVVAVVSLDLSGNLLNGTIPRELGLLVSTRYLDLSNNSLEGAIPDTLGDLRWLESLDLSHNSFTGVIPTSFNKLDSLEFVDLSDNQLEGPIPQAPHWETLFNASRFSGNLGLCGPPFISRPCRNSSANNASFANPVFPAAEHSGSHGIPWLSILLGYVTGFAIVLPMSKCLLANFRAGLIALHSRVYNA